MSETISKIKVFGGPPQAKGIFQTFCKVQQSTINTICSNAQDMQPAAGQLPQADQFGRLNYFQQNSQNDCQHERTM